MSEGSLEVRLKRIEETLISIDQDLKIVEKAIPRTSLNELDSDCHRHYHETVIRSARQQEKFWSELREDLTRKGLTAIMLVVGGLIITGFGVELKALLTRMSG